MKTADLKNTIIQRIAGINDKSFLSAINTIVEAKADSTVYKTTPEQRESIKEGREQIARGEFFTDEEVKKEMEQWLKEK